MIPAARPWALYAGKEERPMKYYVLYIPALIFFLMPLLAVLHDSAAGRSAAREKEKKRAAAAAEQEAAEQARKAAKGARAAAVQEQPRRKRGRPRKNPLPDERSEIIFPAPVEEAPAPVQEQPPAIHMTTIQRTRIFPDVKKMEPPSTPEEFVTRIR